MDNLIKRAEEWLLLHSKHRQPTAEIITALVEQVDEAKQQAHCAGWEQCKQQIIEEWEKPYGLTDGSPFIARLRNMEYKEPESEEQNETKPRQ